ncbi:GNAT family N-acetyltransferase [Algoriphagus sp. PAP.12]|uniref:GNAT family N-acetyltransferase n=1 Tax=Algoriphagus sp. PAP.12 TaxID=2996678 RepID=UPI00227D2AF9|nr:GNAT family N-acetyltransferase [Algoriphagus sp. PAP.12]
MRLHIIEPSIDSQSEIFNNPKGRQLLEIYAGYYPIIGFNPPWVGYAILDQQKLVGSCGFTGKPQDRTVELAYWTFEEFEGKGIATFACKSLIEIALEENPEINIIAKTAPDKNASTRILEKNGFVFTEIVQDHEIGDAWLWTKTP